MSMGRYSHPVRVIQKIFGMFLGMLVKISDGILDTVAPPV